MSKEQQLRKGKISVIKYADIQACPHYIIEPTHYRPDGSCFCNDQNATIMAEWGYRWDATSKRWES